MKAAKQYFLVVLFIMLCKVVLTFESLDQILKRDHWIAVHYAIQGDSDICVCNESSGHSNMSRWAGRFCGDVVMLYKVIHTFNCVDEIRGSICFTFLTLLSFYILPTRKACVGSTRNSPKLDELRDWFKLSLSIPDAVSNTVASPVVLKLTTKSAITLPSL